MAALAFLAITGGGLLTGCSHSAQDAEYSVPILPNSTKAGIDIARYFTLTRIDTGNGEACPIIKDDTLIIFSVPARVSPDGKTLFVNGLSLKAGDEFHVSVLEPVGPYECGGRTYNNAVHNSFGDPAQ
ncbi:hypothetical protein [Trueperella sp. LYQ143]|uniref:hypothetical protein n=1 Tax=unclassified Trueperella TaxID=2630174 RepID=UPI0039837F0C